MLVPYWTAFAQTESTENSEAGGIGLSAAETAAYYAAYFETIDEFLAAAKDEYRSGDADAAGEALIEAYLENFEYLEAPLREVDAQLEEKLEKTLRDELPELVNTDASPEAFGAAVDAALEDLDQAETLLE